MKRYISLLVALSMILTFTCTGVSFAAGQTGFTDVDGTGYETPVGILGALGIMGGYTDGSFHPYSTITRAEMAAVSVRLRGINDYGDTVSLDEVQYKDMDGHPMAAAVAYARSLGIVDGYADGYFYPDEPVTYEQAVKMIVAALGYDYYAEINGGYPYGYIGVASNLKITSGIGITVGSYITRGDVAKMAYKALTADMMTSTFYSDKTSDVTYEVVEGKNILNTYFDVEMLRGVVEENEFTAVDGLGNLEKGQVRIGEEVFKDGGTNIGDYIGYYVSYYAVETEDSDMRTIISYKVESSRNDYIKINAENIVNVKLENSRYVIEYWKNDTSKKTNVARISITPTVIYNGVALTDFSLNDFAPPYGQVTLIDSDRNGVYDMVDVLAYEVMVVLSSASASGTVTSYPNFTTGLRTIKLLEGDEDYTVKLVDGSGRPVTFSMIQKNTVLNVAASKDSDSLVRTAIVSNDSVEGRVQTINEAGEYCIGGNYYPAVSYIEDGDLISVGDTGTFYLTYDGRIAGFDAEQKANKEIGLFIGSLHGTAAEGGDVIKIMKSDGSINVYNLASTVKLNGRNYSGRTLFGMINRETNPLFGKREPESGRLKRVVPEPSRAGIMFKVDKEGNISEIIMNDNGDTVPVATDAPDDIDPETIRCVVQRGKDSGFQNGGKGRNVPDDDTVGAENRSDSVYYSTNYHSFHRGGQQVFVSDSTVLLWSQEGQDRADAQSFWANTPSSLWENYYVEWYEAYFYFLGDKSYADFVVFFDGADETGNSSNSNVNRELKNTMYDNIRIVDRVIETYDADGNTNYRLMYWESGSSAYCDFHPDYDNLCYRDSDATTFWRRGDMVRFIRVEGKIGNIQGLLTTDQYDMYSGNNWNNPVGNELTGGYNPNHRYAFPSGNWEFYGDNSVCQVYTIGRVTNIESLRYFSTMDVNYGSGMLSDEPIEGNCYRLKYDNRGYLSGVENVGNGSIAQDQLILTRKQGVARQLSLRVKESYILYEFEDIEDSEVLRNKYAGLYSEYGWEVAETAQYDDAFDVNENDIDYKSTEIEDAILPEERYSEYDGIDEL